MSLRVERHDAVVSVTLDRPDALNALDGPLTAALTAVTTHTHNDTDAGNRKIQNLHEHIPGVARDWPVVFDSQEVLILQIPNP